MNINNWNKVSKVPTNRLKPIAFGSLKGKSDINPQWRIKAMTEVYGMCGTGWYHELKNKWESKCENGELLCFCEVNVYVKDGENWSMPIVGVGGNKIEVKNKNGLVPNDEGWKMAYTDALGTALKSIGVASEIYEGNFDGSKYLLQSDATPQQLPCITDAEIEKAISWGVEKGKTGRETVSAMSTKKTISNEISALIIDRVDMALSEKSSMEKEM